MKFLDAKDTLSFYCHRCSYCFDPVGNTKGAILAEIFGEDFLLCDRCHARHLEFIDEETLIHPGSLQ